MSKKTWGNKILILLLITVMAVTFTPAAAESATTVYSMEELRTAALAESVGSGDITLGQNIIINTVAPAPYPTGAGLTIGRTLTLDLAGHTLNINLSNTATTGRTANGIKIASGVTLTIMDSDPSTNTLTVINRASTGTTTDNGAAINTTDGTLIIQSGTVIATGGAFGAGIGGGREGNGGNITISGGTVSAVGGEWAAGIGGGFQGSGGNIAISDNAEVTATGGGDKTGAGIGGGYYGSGGNITISNGTVTATGGSSGSSSSISGGGAGIGGGGGDNNGPGGTGGNIIIIGGMINATGIDSGAGIGGGGNRSNNSGGAGGTIRISGGTITATGGYNGAGIGGGGSLRDGGAGGNITISGGTIEAIAAGDALSNRMAIGIGRNGPSYTGNPIGSTFTNFLYWTNGTAATDPGGPGTLNIVTHLYTNPTTFANYKYIRIVPDAATPVISITTQPAASTAVTQGSISGSLSVAATVTGGATLSYQWYSNTTNSNDGGTAVSGAASASFPIPTNLTVGTYYYFCEVGATGATPVRSNVATVTVSAGFVPVANITGVRSTATIGNSTLTGTVVPSSATNQTIAWSVQNAGTTGASISGSNTLNTTAAGSVTVRATIINGLTETTNYTQDFTIAVVERPHLPLPPDNPNNVEEVTFNPIKDVNDVPEIEGFSDAFELNDKDEVVVKEAIARRAAENAVGGSVERVVPLPVISADVTDPGNVAAVTLEVTGKDLMATHTQYVRLIKILSPTRGERFGYAGEPEDYNDMKFTIMTQDYATLYGSIDPEEEYFLIVFIKDGGRFDLDGHDEPNGGIIDPLAIAGGGGAGGGGEEGGGCNAAGVGFLALALLVSVLFVFRRS